MAHQMVKQQAVKKKFRAGIVADLSPNGSIHQQTFLRAMEMADQKLGLTASGIDLVWENDKARFEGGVESSKALVKKKVDIVLGHFASAAAKGALPQYEKKGIPLLLPAATADSLTTDFQSAFRVCSRDSFLVKYILNTLREKGVGSVFVTHDDSIHGKALSGNIIRSLHRSRKVRLEEELSKAGAVIFVGSFTNSIAYARWLKQTGSRQDIYFTDDVVHASLGKALDKLPNRVYVFGYDDYRDRDSALACIAEYFARWKEYPNTYFIETYAAAQVLHAAVQKARITTEASLGNVLYQHRWDTVLGKFRFGISGESNVNNFALWTLQNQRLVKDKIRSKMS
jgi:ABC-type branched-subunit amino acid transport system substrate-binding protein